MKRRSFIGVAVAGAAAAFVSTQFSWLKSLLFQRSMEPLEPSEWQTLNALADVIIPSSPEGPSASEAGALAYLEKLLADRVPRWKLHPRRVPTFSRLLPYYRKLIDRVDAISREKFDVSFAQATADQREKVVEALATAAKGQVGYRVVGLSPVEKASDQELFSMARGHVIQGYFAEPKYGGNRDYRAWESVRHTCHFNYPKEKSSCPPHVM
jgi:gluconate 2-dehydrogenase gamma chain